jgi:hypothetical protein
MKIFPNGLSLIRIAILLSLFPRSLTLKCEITPTLNAAGFDAEVSENTAAIDTIQDEAVYWTNLSGGIFDSPGNWSPAKIPTNGSTAIFGIDSSYAVNIGTHTTGFLLLQETYLSITYIISV